MRYKRHCPRTPLHSLALPCTPLLLLLFFTFHLSPFTLTNAQELTVQAPKSVYVGDNFTVTFIVNDMAQDFHGPSFKGFSLRSGPNRGIQQSTSNINGQWSSSTQTTFSYRLIADVEGTFTVGAASCSAGGKKISSNSFTIKVEKLSQAQQQQRKQQQQQQQRRQSYDPWDQQPQPASQIDANSLFARTSVSKTNPYQGEQIIVTYKIYTQIPISQFAIDKLPGNKGFWAEDLSTGQSRIKQYEETVNNRRYQVAEIRRGALFPQQSGKLTIQPLDLNVLALVQAPRRRSGSIWDLFDDPFFNSTQAVEYPLHTKAVAVNVKPLPTPPDNFSGGVGSFTIKGGVSQSTTSTDEPISYRITLSGHGNLMLVSTPTPTFPSSFEVFDPQIDDNISKGENGIGGSRTFEWVLIPRSQGSFSIPSYDFVYFDPATGKYTTLTIPSQEITVEKGKGPSSASAGKSDVQILSNDIHYMHPVRGLEPKKERESVGVAFWIAAVLIALLTAAAVILGRKRQSQLADIDGLRKRRAVRMARRRLKKAASCLGSGNTELFYEEIYRAIWGCLSDKYGIPLSQLSRDSVSNCLLQKDIPDEQLKNIMKVLEDVDLARFAPGNPETQKQLIYDEALEMIVNLV